VATGVLAARPRHRENTDRRGAVYEALAFGHADVLHTPVDRADGSETRRTRESAVLLGIFARPGSTGHWQTGPSTRPHPVPSLSRQILLNRLLNPEKFSFEDGFPCVVMDEFFTQFNDLERGIVWELNTRLRTRASDCCLLMPTVGKLAPRSTDGCVIRTEKNPATRPRAPSERSRCNTSGSNERHCFNDFSERSPTVDNRRPPHNRVDVLFLSPRNVLDDRPRNRCSSIYIYISTH